MKKILNISFIILLSAGIIVLLGFVNRDPANGNCNNIQVKIVRPDGNMYISEDEVRDQIITYCNNDATQELSIDKIAEIEDNLKKNPIIEKCDIYMDVNGSINANIKQRRPIGRIINAMNESFYLDENGYMIPAIVGRPARVVAVSGHIYESFAPNPYYIENDSAAAISILDELYHIIKYIDKYPFWESQIEQIYVTNQKKFILIPKVGTHEIHFGFADHIEGKFKKLELFYQKGMTRDGWAGYKEVDLQFKNQIICRGANVLYAPQTETNFIQDTTNLIIQ